MLYASHAYTLIIHNLRGFQKILNLQNYVNQISI